MAQNKPTRLPKRRPGPVREQYARRRLSLAEVAPYHRGDRVDGGAALPAAALRLPRRRAAWIEPRGDARDHGAAAVARHHAAGGGDDVWIRLVVGGDSGSRRLATWL